MYLQGFGNYHQTEAVPDSLPINQNSPQRCSRGLYAEQVSGTAFTRARHLNFRTWMYRLIPTAAQGMYFPYGKQIIKNYSKDQAPNPMRWSPLVEKFQVDCDFIDGLFHIAGNDKLNAFVYHCNQSMQNRYFANNDGELLFVPYEGKISLHTECGILEIEPGYIAVIPRGIKFKVVLQERSAKGYICENQGNLLNLPQLGPIGANGLANPRHFEYPEASFENIEQETTLVCKYQERLWTATCPHSPLNVVAWHGNYAPYRYDLSLFNTINTVSFDHPDPSIFTVLTADSDSPGVPSLDFVIFPPRWMVAEHTFRPPYFHRNVMSELMGLVTGEYDAKDEGFVPGGISIHNTMTPHGPDFASYQNTINQTLKPEYYKNTLAFMFETNQPWLITEDAMEHPKRQEEYFQCWQGF